MESTLVPIFICVVLPVAVVLISALTKINSDNKRSEILIKAIEANREVDTDKLLESLRRPQKSARELLNGRLLRGCIFSLVGVVLAIVGLINIGGGAEFESDPVTVPLMLGGSSLAIGVSFLIVYFVTRKDVDK